MSELYKVLKSDVFMDGVIKITFCNSSNRNAINQVFLTELNNILDWIESKVDCKVIVLEGSNGDFCTGMDFNGVDENHDADYDGQKEYSKLLRRIFTFPKIVISAVDGNAIAGGVGIVAASDLVVSSNKSYFGLPEVMWGLLPAMVMPYLVRRIGMQPAKRMMLTYTQISAVEAEKINLVDMVSSELYSAIKRICFRLVRLSNEAIMDAKTYLQKLYPIDADIELRALMKAKELICDEKVKCNILNYKNYKKFPWEN